ncbi:MAG: CYTH and CHAD domain-containing protein [Burkholderiales bacterium]|nr:CYTH and CHAD domain-containing protein [Burkholderiales bacterium]
MATEPRETELKLVLAPGEGARVPLVAPLAGLEGRSSRFSALYFDTPTRELSRHGLGLRLRREGRHWRATLKASGDSSGGLHQRPEWEYPMPGAQLDLSRFANTPLAELPGADTLHERLSPILATEFRRTRWQLEPQPGSRVEVALDQGRIVARGRESPIEEVEIEVLEGPASAAFAVAEALAKGVAMRPEPASKLARGLTLASTARARPVHAARLSIADAPDAREAARRIAAACLAHAQANESGVLDSADVEFVHQLRVALRRLRSAMRLFRDAVLPGEDAAFAEDLRWAAGLLGRCRDWDVFVSETLPPLVAAHGDAAAGKVLLARARARQREARRAAREAIVSPRYGLAMIRLARWVSAPAEPPEGVEPLEDFASRRLRKGAKRVSQGATAFPTLDAPARHRLRILVKRQRYAVEFLGSLFKARPARRHVRALSRVQDALGLANDCANALAHVRELSPPPEFLEFARGWFAAREAAGVEAAARAIAQASGERRFWRRKPAAAPEVPPPA